MQPKNNNNGTRKEGSTLRDPYLSGLARNSNSDKRHYSEAMNAVMDEMSGTATSRRASLYNHLHH